MDLVADFVAVQAVGAVVRLAEVNQSACLSVPVSEAFAEHFEVVAHVRMEDEREGGKTGAGNSIGISLDGELVGAKLVDREETGLWLGDGSHRVVFPLFGANWIAVFVGVLVEQI